MGIQLITAVLCTYALSCMIAYQEGPWSIFLRLRAACGAYDYGPQTGPDGKGIAASRLGRMIKCPYCLSPYAAALLVPASLYLWDWPPVRLLLLIGGVTGACFVILDSMR